MKKTLLTSTLVLALCTAMIGNPVSAEEETPAVISPNTVEVTDTAAENTEAEVQPVVEMPVRVFGTVQIMENGNLLVKSDADENIEYVVKITDETAIVDAATGDPVGKTDIEDGEKVCAWLSNAMTFSLPPQSNAVLIVANAAEESEVPEYYQVVGLDLTPMPAIYPPLPVTEANLPVWDGTTLKIPATAELTPYRTKNIVTLESLVPGTKILTWNDEEGNVDKVVVFPYEYRGYLETANNIVTVSSNVLSKESKNIDGTIYIPIRAAAEEAGYDVSWTREDGAIIADLGNKIISVLPDSDYVMTADGEVMMEGKSIIDNDTIYLTASDIATFLNFFYID